MKTQLTILTSVIHHPFGHAEVLFYGVVETTLQAQVVFLDVLRAASRRDRLVFDDRVEHAGVWLRRRLR